jgi:hypothetical protein
MSTPQAYELKELNEPINLGANPEASPQEGSTGSDEVTLAQPNDQVDRPSKRGAFRPVRNGNIKGSIFAMLASALGTGCLSLPFRAS